jgi:hypothetical protein
MAKPPTRLATRSRKSKPKPKAKPDRVLQCVDRFLAELKLDGRNPPRPQPQADQADRPQHRGLRFNVPVLIDAHDQ